MDLKSTIRVIEDFPIKGISFKDITTLLNNGEAFAYAVDKIDEMIDDNVNVIVAPEARGFIFGTAVAYKRKCRFVPVRKPGKLPAESLSYSYDLEYGKNDLLLHKDAISKCDKIAIIDDLLATGGTLKACAKLVEMLEGEVLNIVAVVELTELPGREVLKGYNCKALVEYKH